MRVDLPIIGGAYDHRVLPIAAQTLKNWYVELNPTKDQATLQTTPGAKPWSPMAGSGIDFEDRGMFEFQGTLYKVTGQNLFSIDYYGAQTEIGRIVGYKRCVFIGDSFNMVIVTGGRVYNYDGTTITEHSGPPQESPDFVTFLNSQAIYDGDAGRFAVSDPGDLTTVDPLNFGTAESAGDPLVRPYAFNEVSYMMGTKTVEVWWNSGNGNPPFDRVQGGILEIGLGAGYSVSNNDELMYFLGDDMRVYRVQSSQSDIVNTIPMFNEFSKYVRTDDAIGFCFTMQNQNFYYLTFPEADKTWLYNENSGIWSQMTTGVNEGANLATSYVSIYGKHLIADGGSIHEWDLDTLDDNGAVIIRERCTQNLAAEILAPQLSGLPVTWNSLELIVDADAPEGNPVLMLSYSDDGGYTFSNERYIELGQAGQYIWQAKLSQLGQSVERVYKFRVSDPVRLTIQRASADVEIGIG